MKAKKKLITSLLPEIDQYFQEEDIQANIAKLDQAKRQTVQQQLKQLDIKKERLASSVTKRRESVNAISQQKFISIRRKS